MGTYKTISEITPCDCSWIEGPFNCIECPYCDEIEVKGKDVEVYCKLTEKQ